MIELNQDEIADYYKSYVNQISDASLSLVDLLKVSLESGTRFLNTVPADKFNYAYAKDKWTVKEVLQHLIDTERVFSYRALSFSRNEPQALPGFDQDAYVLASQAHKREFNKLIEEFKSVRKSTITMFQSFDPKILKRIGTASGTSMSVRAAGAIIVGHQEHHFKVLIKKYL